MSLSSKIENGKLNSSTELLFDVNDDDILGALLSPTIIGSV